MSDNSYIVETLFGNGVTSVTDDGSGTDLVQVLGTYAPIHLVTTWGSSIVMTDSSVHVSFGLLHSIDIFGQIENAQAGSGIDFVSGNALGNIISGDYADTAGGADRLDGNGGNDTIYGMGGSDLLNGNDDNDLIFGEGDPFGPDLGNISAGGDTLYGGTGSDTLYGGQGSNWLYGDTGFDVASYAGFFDDFGQYTYSVSLSLATGTAVVQSRETAGGTLSTVATDTLTSVERIDGTAGDDTMTGYAPGALGEFNGCQFVGGAGNDQLTGDTGLDVLYGGIGNDVLDDGGNVFGSGNDAMNGGAGDDTYRVRASGTVVIENAAGDGFDQVVSYVPTFTLGNNVEDLTLAVGVSTALVGTGNALDNHLFGNQYANTLSGLDGRDWFLGFDGADTLEGGAGNDALWGGNMNDSLSGGSDDDSLFGNYGDDTLTGDDGNDALSGDEDPSLGLNYLIAGNDILSGGDGDDTLAGGLSNNQLNGGTGRDTADYSGFFDDLDTVTYTARIALWSGLATVTGRTTATGISAVVSSDVLTSLERVVGTRGNDWIEGMKAVNANPFSGTDLNGGQGNDTLTNWFGADTLHGGAGDDAYRVLTTTAQIDETAGQGNDILYAGVSFKLAADDNIERLATILSSATTAINLTGNDLAQTLTGNAGVNVLYGGGGNDTLSGLAGADTLVGGSGVDRLIGGADSDWYYVDNAADVIVETVGGGTADRVLAWVSFTLAADDDVEVLSTNAIAGVSAINLTGNALSQSLIGNAGANFLSGAGGDDRMTGLAGNDSLSGSSGNDTLLGGAGNDVLSGGTGFDDFIFDTALGPTNVDVISAYVVADDMIRLDHRIFTGLTAGQDLADTAFATNSTGEAVLSTDRIIYQTGTGKLFYDADGAGGAAAVQFARLTTNLAGFDAGEFFVF